MLSRKQRKLFKSCLFVSVILIIAVIASTSNPESSQPGSHITTPGCLFDPMDSENESEKSQLPEIVIPPIFQNISQIILQIGRKPRVVPIDKCSKDLFLRQGHLQ